MATLVIGTNSYTDETTATDYITGFIGDDAWAAASVAVREGALIEATQIIDLNFNFLGSAQSESQSLAFPRETFTYYDRVLDKTLSITAGTYPDKLVHATVIQAAHLLTFKDELSSGNTGVIFDNITIDVISVSDSSRNNTQKNVDLIPTTVRKMLSSITSDGGGAYSSNWWRNN